MKLYDKNRREIKVNDVLKVFHFTGHRRKKYYMYKIVKGIITGKNGEYLDISHLPMSSGSYRVLMNGDIKEEIEIVQGYDEDGRGFDERPKRTEPTVPEE